MYMYIYMHIIVQIILYINTSWYVKNGVANGDLLRELMSAKCKSETMPSLYFVPDHEEGHIPMSQVIKQQKLSLRKSLVKHSEAATFVIVPPNFLEGQIWPKDLKFYQVSPLERDFGQETLIRDENDHIEVSDSQILQICPWAKCTFFRTSAYDGGAGRSCSSNATTTSLSTCTQDSPQGSLQCQLLASPCSKVGYTSHSWHLLNGVKFKLPAPFVNLDQNQAYSFH